MPVKLRILRTLEAVAFVSNLRSSRGQGYRALNYDALARPAAGLYRVIIELATAELPR